MGNQEEIKLKIVLSLSSNMTLKDLEKQRIDLANFLSSELSSQAEIKQPSASRSLDPAVIGAVGLAILPVTIQKLADLIVKWAELRKDSVMVINIPLKGKDSITISYNPKTTSAETLKKWIATAVESSKLTQK